MFPVFFTVANFEFRASYLFLTLAIIAGLVLGYKESRRVGLSDQNFRLYAISVIPFALLLGAINALLFRYPLADALERLEHSFSNGLISFGAIAGTLLLGYILSKVRKQNTGVTLDTISLILPLVLGIYRIGCVLNGCCHGLETESFLGVVLPDDFGIWARRYPTQIWLMLFNLGLFAWLWSLRKKKSFDGIITIYYLLAYSLGRLIIDAFRELPPALGPLSLHQVMALTMLLATLYAYAEIYFARRSAGE
ncbi:MAG: hypothetical protein HN916_08870 [Anaerolineae bacterium]|jgi:prolipoprotein diacylglyceryltransferase|nr:hypothetical protein [Anaerolineae bacterium]